MGGFFGAVSERDCIIDVFFGVDYHSHLGTRRGGMAAYDEEIGLQREIHNIENSPFRTKFEGITEEMKGRACIGCISDSDPQPLLIRSELGTYAICTVGAINNSTELVDKYLTTGGHFSAMTGGKVNSTELVAALISQKSSFVEGIKFVQDVIDGSMSILILKEGGSIIAARDKMGRIPVLLGKDDEGHCVTFESFAYDKLGYTPEKELGPGEIVEITSKKIEVLSEARKEMKICAFLWTYYGYPTSIYEGVNVEAMRYRNGEIMAENDAILQNAEDLDSVCGVPDSGIPHAIGYANKSHTPFARPFIKYTPTWSRSFMSSKQQERAKVAKMKLIPVQELIEDKNLLFVDDSIVRGTQLKETVDFLYDNGAKSVHMRSACPPIMYGCKYLNFSRSTSEMDLITRRTIKEMEGDGKNVNLSAYSNPETPEYQEMVKRIGVKLNFTTLRYHRLDDMIEAVGIDRSKLCTYCWDGKED